jgi:hypothetical protein
MSRPNITGFLAALTSGHADLFPLLELQFASGTQYLCGLPYAVTWNGNTYIGTGGVVSISESTETGGTAQGIQVVISGVLPANKSLLANEKVQNRKLIYRLAAIDSSNALQVDPNVWSGAMDYMDLDNTGDAPKITIYAEHYMILWDKPRTVRFTDSAQKRIDSTDRGLEFVAKISEASIVWPSRAALLAQ